MPTRVGVTLPSPTMVVGETQQPVATITVSEGDALLNARAISWASSNPAVASVTASDVVTTVTAVSAGIADISATVDGVSGSATVSVSLPEVAITAEQEAQIAAVPVGVSFVLKGPTGNTFLCDKAPA